MAIKLSVVCPTKNESANIRKLLIELLSLQTFNYDYEVVIVDDSDDATAKIAKGLGARVIIGQRKGLGQAIIDGIKASKGDIVIVMDADGSHPIRSIPVMVRTVTDFGYDMAIGSRYVNGGKIIGWNKKRRIISAVASMLAYPITGLRDNTSGYFAFQRSILNGADLKPSSWKIMLEVLVKAKPQKVLETPIIFEDRIAGESKFNNKEAFAYLKHLFKLAMFKYRILNFSLVGGIGYIINMGIYYPLTLLFKNDVTFLGQHFYLPPFVISSLIAITSNYYLNKAWTFGDRKASSLSYLRYLGMALVTLLLDIFLLFVFVDFGDLIPIVAAALAIAIAFIIRFFVSDKWIWRKAKREQTHI